MSKSKLRRPRHAYADMAALDVKEDTYANTLTVIIYDQHRKGESGSRKVTLTMRPADATNLINWLRQSVERMASHMKHDLDGALGRLP